MLNLSWTALVLLSLGCMLFEGRPLCSIRLLTWWGSRKLNPSAVRECFHNQVEQTASVDSHAQLLGNSQCKTMVLVTLRKNAAQSSYQLTHTDNSSFEMSCCTLKWNETMIWTLTFQFLLRQTDISTCVSHGCMDCFLVYLKIVVFVSRVLFLVRVIQSLCFHVVFYMPIPGTNDQA